MTKKSSARLKIFRTCWPPIVLDYLKDAPYPGVIKARVADGDRYMEYMLLLENDTLHVYLHALQADRSEVQEQSQHPDGSKELPDREESA